MKCNKCGTEVNPQDEFCYNCGAQITLKKEKQKKKPEVQEYQLKDKEIEKLSQSFASRDEKYIASLGNGYIMNYLTKGSMSKGFAYISNKRVYFKGSCLSGNGKKLVKTDEERTVDIKNITGSGFIYHRQWEMYMILVLLLALLVGAFCWLEFASELPNLESVVSRLQDGNEVEKYEIVSTASITTIFITAAISIILLFKKYFLGRKTLFRIEYAGGCIAFDVSFYAKAEIDDFQKQLRRTKDYAEETNTVKTVTVETPTQTSLQSSVADDLRKYADLLKDGLISQEEYDAMKKKVLGL